MRAFVCAGAGFLLAVVWFDLMHDVQVLRLGPGEDAGQALTSIASYYRRVTTDARPMNRLVAAVMAATLAAIVVELEQAGDSAKAAAEADTGAGEATKQAVLDAHLSICILKSKL